MIRRRHTTPTLRRRQIKSLHTEGFINLTQRLLTLSTPTFNCCGLCSREWIKIRQRTKNVCSRRVIRRKKAALSGGSLGGGAGAAAWNISDFARGRLNKTEFSVISLERSPRALRAPPSSGGVGSRLFNLCADKLASQTSRIGFGGKLLLLHPGDAPTIVCFRFSNKAPRLLLFPFTIRSQKRLPARTNAAE